MRISIKILSHFIFLIIIIIIQSCSKDEIIEFPKTRCEDTEAICESVSKLPEDIESTISRLRIIGNRIVDNDCNCKILKGVVIEDPYFLLEISKINIEELIGKLKTEWNVSIIRIPIHPCLWDSNENYTEKYLAPIVDICNKNGIYAYIGWHAQGNIHLDESFIPDWRSNYPWNGNPYNVNKELAISALKTIGQRFYNYPNVVYGIFNEPAEGIKWEEFRTHAHDLIDNLRNNSPQSIVFVAGTNFGYDLSDAVDNPINRPNIVYETHPYPHKGNNWQNTLLQLMQNKPVFIGEWGFCDNTSSDYCANFLHSNIEEYAIPLLEFTKENEIGWFAWAYSSTWTPNLIDSAEKKTNHGQIVYNYLNE